MPASRRCCDLIVAMMVDRLIAPRSKLGFVRAVDEETATIESGRGACAWAGSRSAKPTRRWIGCSNGRHGSRTAWRGGISKTACWCSTTSAPLTSRAAAVRWRAMATAGITASDRPQIVYGLLCTREGLPIAVEVFDGNTADPSTLECADREGEGSLRHQPSWCWSEIAA